MKKKLLILVLLPLFSFSQNYTMTPVSLGYTDLTNSPGGGGGGSLSIANNILNVSLNAGWNTAPMKLGTIKTLNITPLITYLELGEIMTGTSASGYFVKIDNNNLVIYIKTYPANISSCYLSFTKNLTQNAGKIKFSYDTAGNQTLREFVVPPSPPIAATPTQPTCTVATGSVVLSNLPSGNWTINPGAITGNTTTTTITGIVSGTYAYTVTNAAGDTSTATNIIINAQPIQSAPIPATPTQPVSSGATGSVVLNGLPTGNWTINPGAITGSTTSTTITGLVPGTYSYTVTNASGCTSVTSANVVINSPSQYPVSYASLYPNPATSYTTASWYCPSMTYPVNYITVSTMAGGVLNSYYGLGSLSSFTLPNFGNYPTGYYSVVLYYFSGEQKSFTIIKQ